MGKVKCGTCKGDGSVKIKDNSGDTVVIRCTSCGGTGEVESDD